MDERRGSLVLTFLAGAAVGAAVALLTTPQTGRRTRRQIKRTAEDVQGYLEEVGEELMDKGRELMERGRDAAGQAAHDIGRRVRQVAP